MRIWRGRKLHSLEKTTLKNGVNLSSEPRRATTLLHSARQQYRFRSQDIGIRPPWLMLQWQTRQGLQVVIPLTFCLITNAKTSPGGLARSPFGWHRLNVMLISAGCRRQESRSASRNTSFFPPLLLPTPPRIISDAGIREALPRLFTKFEVSSSG